jgi:hypothetical protein
MLSPISPAEPWPVQQKEMMFGKKGHISYKKAKSPDVREIRKPAKKVAKKSPIKTTKRQAFDLELSPILKSPEIIPFNIFEKDKPKITPKKSPKISPKKSLKKARKVSPPKKISVKKISPKKATPAAPKPQKLSLKEFLSTKGIAIDSKTILNGTPEELNELVSKESIICSSIQNGELTFLNFIGKGGYGEVFGLTFPSNAPGKKYVVKKSKKEHLPSCLTVDKTYKRVDGRGDFYVSKGNFVCDETLSEFIISLLAGDLTRVSSNFINTYYFGLCNKKMQYTFMESVDSSLDKLHGLKPSQIESLYIQIIHAVALFQKTYKIVHGDLKMDNIFVENILSNSRAKEFENADYFGYMINGNQIYIPTSPWIAKIGDWGLAVKYSPKIVAFEDVLTGFFDEYGKAVSPNFYSEAYDVAFITVLMYFKFPHVELIKNCMAWILKCDPVDINDNFDRCYNVKSAKYRFRPNVDELAKGNLSHVSPLALLEDPLLMGSYYKKPTGKYTVSVLGIL